MAMDNETWTAGLKMLSDKDPDNQFLDDLVNGGLTYVNSHILSAQLQGLANKKQADKPQPDDVVTIPPISKKDANDSILNDLHFQKIRLFSKRAILSNSFHKQNSDADRCVVSVRITDIQQAIKGINESVRQYKASGKIPDQYNDKFPIPVSDLEKYKLSQSLIQRISHKKAHIKRISKDKTLDQDTRSHRMERADKKLKELMTYKKHVNEAIDQKD